MSARDELVLNGMAALVCLAQATVAAAVPSVPVRRWLTAGEAVIVDIALCGTALCRSVVRVLEPAPDTSAVDVRAPNAPVPATHRNTHDPDPLRSRRHPAKEQIYKTRNGRTCCSFMLCGPKARWH